MMRKMITRLAESLLHETVVTLCLESRYWYSLHYKF